VRTLVSDLDLDLPPIALDVLAQHATRTAPRADADALRALLLERGFTAHAAVLAFEARYGGLHVLEGHPSVASLLIGPYAFHRSLPAYRGHHPELVPVMTTTHDVVYLLDADGRGYATSTMVDGRARPLARDARQLVTQALLWCALDLLPRSYVAIEGSHGEARAAALGLAPITEASSEHERWWGGLDRLVVEIAYGNGFDGAVTYVGR
jgi:hypothetical protein